MTRTTPTGGLNPGAFFWGNSTTQFATPNATQTFFPMMSVILRF